MTTGAAPGDHAGRKRGVRLYAVMTVSLAILGFGSPANAQDDQNRLRHAGDRSLLAQAAPDERDFEIPAQALTSALALFGQQAGVQITVDGALVRNLASPGAVGMMTPDQALRRLLAGTGLTYDLAGGTTIVIERLAAQNSGPLQLQPITVTSQLQQRDLQETRPASPSLPATNWTRARIPTSRTSSTARRTSMTLLAVWA